MAGFLTNAWVNDSAPAIDAQSLIDMGEAIEISEHPYGVCSTAAATAAKTVTIDFSGTLALFTGLTVRVKFTNVNTAANPTLNVNSTSDVPIMAYGTTNAPLDAWDAGQVVELTYDGTNWQLSKPTSASASLTAKANKADLSNIFQTSPTCTEANGIGEGKYFYLDNVLVQALTSISNGANFTSGTNYSTVTAGALNELKSAITQRTRPATVLIQPVNTETENSSITLYRFDAILLVICNSTGKIWNISSLVPTSLIVNGIVTRANLYVGADEVDFSFSEYSVKVLGTSGSSVYGAIYGIIFGPA